MPQAFASSEEFVDHILTRFYEDMRTEVTDNYDAGRFSYDGVDRSRSTYTELHVETQKALLRHSNSFFRVWSLLADPYSRDLYIDLLRYRLAGHLHVKLPINTLEYWDHLHKSVTEIPSTPSALNIPVFSGGKLVHYEFTFENQPLKLEGTSLWPFYFRQYFYERNGISIRPEIGDHVIDAGAGIGDTSLAFGCATGPTGCVYLFELLEAHLEACNYNVKQNSELSKFRIFSTGLSDTVFTPSHHHTTETKYQPGFSIAAENTGFATTTLDHLIAQNEIPRVDFIKMDIEGSELKALYGAEKTLRRFKPRLAISLYHDIEHFYAVPLFIESLNLGYRFHLNHYTIHVGETVLYATANP